MIWEIECMKNLRQFQVTFATDCSQLVKMVSEPEEWPAFESYLKDIKFLQGSFLNSDVVHVPRTENQRADNLARSGRKQPSFVAYMDAELPFWFTESIWVCKCLVVKKKKQIKFIYYLKNKFYQILLKFKIKRKKRLLSNNFIKKKN